MATDILITPASGTIDFNNGTQYSINGTIATMEVDDSLTAGNLSIHHDGSGVMFLDRSVPGNVFEVFGSYGTLFAINDDLSNSLFSVNNAAGQSVFEVFANNTIVGGAYGANSFYLDSNGNLGLGTGSPSSILQIGAGSFPNPNSGYDIVHLGGLSLMGRSNRDVYISANAYYATSGWLVKYGGYQPLVMDMLDGRFVWNIGTGTTAGSSAGMNEIMRLNTTGLGIGTANPGYKLHVNGNGSTLNNTFYVDVGNYNGATVLFEHTGSTTPVPFMIKKSGYSGNAQAYGLLHLHMDHANAGGGSNLYFTLDDSAGNVTEYGGLGAYIQDATNGSEDGALTFMTTEAGAARQRRMTILNDGNVGIGTTSPSQKLDVSGNSLVTGNTYIGDTNRYFKSNSSGVLFQTAHGYLFFGPDNSSWGHIQTDRANFYFNKSLAVNGGMIQSYDENLVLNAAVDTARAIEFRSGGTTYMYMNAGSLGIGQTSPVTKLHIAVDNNSVHAPTAYTNNGVKALTLRTQEGDGLEWHLAHSTNGYTGWVAAARVNNTGGSWGNGYLEFTTASSSSGAGNANVLVLSGTGNVGIGTSSPIAKLNVKAANGTAGLSIGNTTGDTRLDITSTENSNVTFDICDAADGSTARQLIIKTGGTERMRVTSSGCVGVGLTTPLTNSLMTVNGRFAVGNASYNNNLNSGTADFSVDCDGTPMISWVGNYLQIGGTNQNYSMRMYNGLLQTWSTHLYIRAGGTGTAYRLYLGTNGQTQTITCYNGSVGIGDNTPSYKLDVDGDVRCKASIGIGGTPATSRVVTITNISSTERPAIKIVNPNFSSDTSSTGKTFYRWLPIDIDGTTRWIAIYS